MSGPNLTGRNFPGQGQRSLSDRTIRQGQYSPPANEKQNMSLGEFLTDEAVRGDLPQKRRHLMTINKPVSGVDDPSMFRETYRKHLTELHDNPSLRSAFVGAHQLENLREVVDTFYEAAGRDLASTGPQVDQRFLDALLVELGKLKTIRTGYETAQEVLRHLPPDVDRCLMEKTFKDA
jgi:hypothetical protein